MLCKHHPKMKSSKKKHLRKEIFHENKDSESIDQSKNEFHFISLAMKANVNKFFFVVKRNLISVRFHFEYSEISQATLMKEVSEKLL